MELQLQIYLILGIGSFFIAALVLSNSLLIYYVIKLYKKVSEERNENSYLRKYESGIINNAVEVDDELSRRYTMHTPEPQSLQSLEITRQDDRSMKRKANKDSMKPNNVRRVSRDSVIDQREDGTFNSVHESRTAFNDRY
ncbi:hypothetical protein ACKWTF_012307 [Chironomus riparius]